MSRLQIVIYCFLCACSWYPDNPVEEAIESKIEDYTGLDIDLSADDEEL